MMDDKNNQSQTKSETPTPKLNNEELKKEDQDAKNPSEETNKSESTDNKKPTTDPKKDTGIKSKLTSKPMVIAMMVTFVIISLLFIIMLIFGGSSDSEENLQNTELSATPTLAPNITFSPELIPPQGETSNEDVEFKTFRSDKLLGIDYPGLLITYPTSWTFQNQRFDSKSSLKVILKKDAYILIVEQRGDLENIICLYADERVPDDTIYIDLTDFLVKKIDTSWGEIRRTEEKVDGFRKYTYCEESGRNNETPLSVGLISLTGPIEKNSEILNEAEEIIKSIEIL